MAKEPYTPHPNFSSQVNAVLAEQDLSGGVWLKPFGDEPYLATGKSLHVQTTVALYVIEKRGDDEFYISGDRCHCVTPVRCRIQGSNYGGSMLKMNYVGRGMYMEFTTEEHPKVIVTSQIQEITEI